MNVLAKSVFVATCVLFFASCAGQSKTTPLRSNAPSHRGFYLPAQLLSGQRLLDKMDLAQRLGLDSLVIDLKDTSGKLALPPSDSLLVGYPRYSSDRVGDYPLLMSEAKKRGLYLIARVSLFRDPCSAAHHPSWAVRRENGDLYTTREGDTDCGPTSFVSPYVKEVWLYNAEIALAAAKLGFDEIQLDYVRFPDEVNQKLQFPGKIFTTATASDVIAEGVSLIKSKLPAKTKLSADVFGRVVLGPDEIIGQDAVKLAPHVDFLSPMLYPSLWTSGPLGIDNPADHPYETISESVVRLNKLLDEKKLGALALRPWIQVGDWGTKNYGDKELDLQVRALCAHGINSWLIWQTSGEYKLTKPPLKCQ